MMCQGSRANARRTGLRAKQWRWLVGTLGLLSVWAFGTATAQASTAPANTAPPVVSGARGVGNTLTATTGTWTGTEPMTFSYQWERCGSRGACSEIAGATASTYLQVGADAGKLVLVAVTATNEAGSATATSAGMPAESWGQNDHGQLGAIYKDPYEEYPVDVEGLTSIKAIAATESFNLALLSDGTVASFGGDDNGQLGDNERKSTWERGLTHVAVKSLAGVTAVAGYGEHALALTKNGAVWAWGSNQDGELGQEVGGFESVSGINSRIPNEVPELKEKAIAIAAGGASDFALLEGGEVEAWGQNEYGELGVRWNPECKKANSTASACKPFICKTGGGNHLCDTSPHPVVDAAGNPIKHVVAIAASSESGYALLENGHVLSWGSNRYGALGQPSTEVGSSAKFITPGEVQREFGTEALTHVTELAAGAHHVLAVVEGGEVVGWGGGEEGDLGVLPGLHWTCSGKTACMDGAFAIKGLEGVTGEAISAGSRYSLVLAGAHVYAFGKDQRGELANGVTLESGNSTPTSEPKLEGAVEIAAGSSHGLGLVPEPPAPHIVVHTESGHVKFSWLTLETLPNHLNYHEFERPGLGEPEGEGEQCNGEAEAEGLYPKTCPGIKHNPVSPGNLTTLGQTLEAKNGTWHGAEPIAFTYQWQRCNGEMVCAEIPEATGSSYHPTEADLGSYIRLLVTAKDVEGETAQSGTVPTEPTTRVQKATAKESTIYSVNIKKEEEKGEITGNELRITQGHSGEPTTLAKVPWEFKVSFGAKARWFIATPE